MYFCVLEALHNVIRHADAGSAQVALRDDGASLMFEVRDAGVGFDPESTGPGNGLLNMTDRVDAVGGTLSVDSTVGRGTVISGKLPMEKAP